MTISRRDTILIAVLINIGLLAILFMTAMQVDKGAGEKPVDRQAAADIHRPTEPVQVEKPMPSPIAAVPELPTDEVDRALNEYQARLQQSEAAAAQKIVQKAAEPYIQITVKRGDALEKIARANGTTIREIRKLNDLKTDVLAIGQKLKVPRKAAPAAEVSTAQAEDDSIYYVVKNGDNPWKIARKFHVKYDDILLLNSLNEEKARNLKVGDTIKVK